MSSFLPQNVEVPTGGAGGYTKFPEGETRVRVLSDVIVGYEYWNHDGKPVRVKERPAGKPADMRQTDSNGREERVKMFWAMKAYNYGEKRMEIMQVTQTSIMNALVTLNADPEYGHPKGYDLKIKRSGTGLKTEYSITPGVPKKVADEVKEAYQGTPITLEGLFGGGNPFGAVAQAAAAPSGQAPLPRESAQPKKVTPKPVPAPQPVAAGDDDDEEGDNDLPF